ncbi:MAG: hypothetical protein CMC93_05605 [Flavobacteriaceae bacterium]|nr:hypothetical protein [Flavobacteriaceae bacterium]
MSIKILQMIKLFIILFVAVSANNPDPTAPRFDHELPEPESAQRFDPELPEPKSAPGFDPGTLTGYDARNGTIINFTSPNGTINNFSSPIGTIINFTSQDEPVDNLTYTDINPECPNVKDSVLYDHRLDLVKCNKNTLRKYIKYYNCCTESSIGCYMIFNAYQLVDPTDLNLCYKNNTEV